MLKVKQVKESKAIETIRTIIKSGRTIKNVTYNGQPSVHRYVKITYVEPLNITL